MKNKITFLFILLLSMTTMTSCDDNIKVEERGRPLIIGHRATGVGVNDGFIENTMPAIREVLKYIDGVEVDIQMSSSKTLWVYHDDLFANLDDASKALLESKEYLCLINTPDSIIEKLRICRKGIEERLYKLEEVFSEIVKNKDKIISIDIKGYFHPSCVEGRNVDRTYQYELADALYALAKEHDAKEQIIAETVYIGVFDRLKELDKTIQCYYLIDSQMDEKINFALENKADGLSINIYDKTINTEQINKAQGKGLKIKFWGVLIKEDLNLALKYDPYAIEISNLELIRTISTSGDSLQINSL